MNIGEIYDYYNEHFDIQKSVFENITSSGLNILYELIKYNKIIFFPEELYHFIGSYYYIQKNIKESVKYYMLSIEKNDKFLAESYQNIGDFYTDNEATDVAKKYYLLAFNKKYCPLVSFKLASIYNKERNFELAKKYYLYSCLEIHNDPIIFYRLARIYAREKNKISEKIYLLEASKLNYIPANFILGVLDVRQRNYILAKINFQKCFDEKYNVPKSSRYLASIFEIENDLKSAKKYFEIAHEHNPDDYHIIYRLGKICYKKNDIETAKAYFISALTMSNSNNKKCYDIINHKYLPQHYILYQLGKLYEINNLETAISYYFSAIKLSRIYNKIYVSSYVRCHSINQNEIIFNLLKDNTRIEELENKITDKIYKPGGIGYLSAKDNFYKLAKNK